METRKFLVALLLFAILSLSFAQTAPVVDPAAGPAVTPNPVSPESDYTMPFESIGSITGSVLNKFVDLIAELTYPLPGGPIMDEQICRPTQNAILNLFLIGGDLYKISFLAAAAGMMFISFMYLLGKIFENKKWVDYAKNEIFEILITIIVVLLILVPLLKIVGCINPFEPGTTTYQAAFAYPKDIISSVTFMSVVIYWINAVLQNMLQVKVTQNIFAGLSGSMGVGGDDPSFGSLSQAGMILVVVTGLASLMAYIHELVTYGFIAYLLPIGMLTRFFAPTRKIGGTIIGLVFGMAILMPFMMAIGHSVIAVNFFPIYFTLDGSGGGHIYPKAVPEIADKLTELLTFDAVVSSQQDVSSTEGIATNEYGEPVETPALASNNNWLLGFLFGMISNTISTVYGLLILVTGGGVLCFGATIYPLIMSIVLISGVKYMSSTLGEEIDVTNLTRLI